MPKEFLTLGVCYGCMAIGFAAGAIVTAFPLFKVLQVSWDRSHDALWLDDEELEALWDRSSEVDDPAATDDERAAMDRANAKLDELWSRRVRVKNAQKSA